MWLQWCPFNNIKWIHIMEIINLLLLSLHMRLHKNAWFHAIRISSLNIFYILHLPFFFLTLDAFYKHIRITNLFYHNAFLYTLSIFQSIWKWSDLLCICGCNNVIFGLSCDYTILWKCSNPSLHQWLQQCHIRVIL